MEKDPKLSPTATSPMRTRAIIVLVIALLVGCLFAAKFLRPQSDADPMDLPVVTHLNNPDKSNKSDPDTSVASTNNDPQRPLTLPERISQAAIDAAEHPFDPLLEIAESCVRKIDAEVYDYSAVMTSQVRIDGVLKAPRKLMCKIRHPRNEPNKNTFSVYTRFLEPESIKGQEAIWVDGWHKNNIVAHITGIANVKRFYLPPDSSYAMDGNLHPISDIGFRQLLVKMCDVAKKDRKYGECIVTVTKGLVMDGHKCTMLEAKHPVKRDHFEFHIARIYIDDQREIPLAYEGYMWPEQDGGEPVLLEKYYYSDVKFNQGFKDIDFDPANEAYDYPSF